MAVPWSAVIAGSLGLVAGVRAVYHPWRALTRTGFVRSCATATGCDPSMVIDAGGGAVYAPLCGLVVSAGADWIVLKPDADDVLLSYVWSPGTSVSMLVMAGQHVGAGQQLAIGGVFSFSVKQVVRGAAGVALGAPFEPASWLAVRGLRVSTKASAQTQWCEGGRSLSVPQTVAKCGIDLPSPSPLSLLPVTVSLR